MWGKLKLNFQPVKYYKNNSTKIILEKNMWGNTVIKQKSCRETL